ncbi:uncharacterized protein B0H18DRAFT_18401 [Fomitopsis serialis]|uniref:uncharacterized protein n=1 Tax=Fomitopsis serialis TaxID=139415 RepID=UPI002008AD0C|nr:uncharacterized protein B0H18DRAFT_18401 [Neoantrodia serialis]KAH9938531.1 hypothetical protein B0H18DRAFT_18401 [Neoantrodia serialis]
MFYRRFGCATITDMYLPLFALDPTYLRQIEGTPQRGGTVILRASAQTCCKMTETGPNATTAIRNALFDPTNPMLVFLGREKILCFIQTARQSAVYLSTVSKQVCKYVHVCPELGLAVVHRARLEPLPVYAGGRRTRKWRETTSQSSLRVGVSVSIGSIRHFKGFCNVTLDSPGSHNSAAPGQEVESVPTGVTRRYPHERL